MRTVAFCLAALLVLGCASSRPDGDRDAAPLTLDRLLSGPSLTGTSPSSPTWSPDSRHLAFRWKDPAGSRREIWLVDADGSNLRRLTSESEGRTSVREFAWMPDGSSLLYTRARALWRIDLSGKSEKLTTFARSPGDLAVSPDGRYVSTLLDGDLWLYVLDDREHTKLTDVAVPSISNLPVGRYRRRDVEIGSYIWGGPTYAWAPDSRRIAVHHVDRRNVRKVPFPNYLADETDPNFVRRSYPGDPNEARTVAILDVATQQLDVLELPDPTGTRVVDFSWSKDGALLIDRESDTAVDRWLHVRDPDGELREVWHDHRETRVYTTSGSAWHADGAHVLVLADIAERYGLFALDLDRAELRLASDAAFDTTGGPVVTGDGAIFYTTNEPNPYENHVCRTSLDGNPHRITRRPGTMRPYPSPDGMRVALLHTDDTNPTELYLTDAAGRGEEQRITHSPPPEFERQRWAVARYVTFPSLTDDATLHARILEPRDLDPDRRYPVLFGPVYSNTVRKRWRGFYSTFQQLLVQQGYIVVQVDVRGSTGYGREFREQFLADFAGRDLDDLESAVAYIESLPHVDPDRIGIWGSSYGGTLTTYALLKKPGLFDAGVACAAAVDPHFFGGDDVAIVRQPDTHPAAFLRGAAQFAKNLEDPLLFIHGMQDQVVPFKTVVALAEALMREGKDFDFAFAPTATHGWTSRPHYARYLLGKLLAHFERHLGPDSVR